MPAPPSTSATPPGVKPDGNTGIRDISERTAKSADDINDLFEDLDETPVKEEKKPKPEEEEKEPKKTEKPEEEIELVDVDEEEDEEVLDLKEEADVEIDAPPRKKEILKEYPELFKKFPFFREGNVS